MASPARVDEYIDAAMGLALIECVNDVFAATIPNAVGIVAFGATKEDCANDLRARLEDWVTASLSEGESLPVLGGIDLSTSDAQTFTACSSHTPTSTGGTFFESDQEFFSALTKWERKG